MGRTHHGRVRDHVSTGKTAGLVFRAGNSAGKCWFLLQGTLADAQVSFLSVCLHSVSPLCPALSSSILLSRLPCP
jgi:hypothetical protein